MSAESVILAELRALRSEVQVLQDVLQGPKSRKRYLSGAAAARILGTSYPTFKKKFVHTGKIARAHNGKFAAKKVQQLKEVAA